MNLPSDPAYPLRGDLYFETRSENWSRGAKTLRFLKKNSWSKDLEKVMILKN